MEAVVVLVKQSGQERQLLQSQVVAARSPYTADRQSPSLVMSWLNVGISMPWLPCWG